MLIEPPDSSKKVTSDLVLVKKSHDCFKKLAKLESPWIGPFKIFSQHSSVTYLLDLPASVRLFLSDTSNHIMLTSRSDILLNKKSLLFL
jgi:hypothetical protein